MDIIAGGRGTGKTCRLLDLAYKNDAIVVCKYPEEILRKARGYGISGIQVCSFDDYPTLVNEENKPIYILNIKMFIEHFDPQVKGCSITLEELK